MRVLVISDNERVRGLFERLEMGGELELRVIADLAHSDAEIAGFRPGHVFVQSRMSGLCADIVLRHLKKLLPDAARVVILAVDADDAAGAKKRGMTTLDLTAGDDALAAGIACVLQDAPPAKKGSKGKPAGAARPRPARTGIAAVNVPPPAADGTAPPVAQVAPLDPVQPHPAPPEQPPPREGGNQVAVDAATPIVQASFEEIMRRAAVKEALAAPPAHDCTSPGKPAPSPPVADGDPGDSPAAPPDPIPEPQLSAGRRFIPLVLALILIPGLYLLLNKPPAQKDKPTQRLAPAPATAPSTAPVANPRVPTERSSRQTAPPAQPSTRNAATNPAALPAVPAAKPAPSPQQVGGAVEAGVKELPPFLAGVKMDPLYSKVHPGWERYPGARAEYRLFRKGGLYKAIQVIALTGQTVPDEVFRRVLSEFGGADSYTVQSTELKERYFVEHCAGRGDVAVTIYRRANDRRIKGAVVYYK